MPPRRSFRSQPDVLISEGREEEGDEDSDVGVGSKSNWGGVKCPPPSPPPFELAGNHRVGESRFSLSGGVIAVCVIGQVVYVWMAPLQRRRNVSAKILIRSKRCVQMKT